MRLMSDRLSQRVELLVLGVVLVFLSPWLKVGEGFSC